MGVRVRVRIKVMVRVRVNIRARVRLGVRVSARVRVTVWFRVTVPGRQRENSPHGHEAPVSNTRSSILPSNAPIISHELCIACQKKK